MTPAMVALARDMNRDDGTEIRLFRDPRTDRWCTYHNRGTYADSWAWLAQETTVARAMLRRGYLEHVPEHSSDYRQRYVLSVKGTAEIDTAL